jgi:type II secretion system protein H
MFGLGPLTALMAEKGQGPIWETGNGAGMKRSFHAGFTLLELMIVIILIGVVTAVVLPEMRGTYEDMLLRSTSRKVLDLSALASSRAVTTGKEQQIRFDTAHASYDLGEAKSSMDGEFAAEKSFEKGNWDSRIVLELRRSELEPSEGEEIEENPKSKPNALSFFSDGTADAKEIRLHDRQGISITLKMNATTARFKIVEDLKE